MPNVIPQPFAGKGSWFGNAPGGWTDAMNGSTTASGVPTSTPGIALPNRATLGQMFQVTAPNGQTYTLPQIDVGPAARTGRSVDISAGAAAKMGYTPGNFPTDSQFKIAPVQQAALAPASSSSSSFGDVIQQARQVALQGGPQAVQKFMAAQGYPQNGAWCGEFAASVIKSVGGTPPANPEVASNWRNFGAPTTNPQPGDIAVRNVSRFNGGPVQTGQLGSHVTFVENVDPNKGVFTGLGGNQSAPESTFPLNQYDFRHPVQVASNGAVPLPPRPFGDPVYPPNFDAYPDANGHSPGAVADASAQGILNPPPGQNLNGSQWNFPAMTPGPQVSLPSNIPTAGLFSPGDTPSPMTAANIPQMPAAPPPPPPPPVQIAQATPQPPQTPQTPQTPGAGFNPLGILGSLGNLASLAGMQRQQPAPQPPPLAPPFHPQSDMTPLMAFLQKSPLTQLASLPQGWNTFPSWG